MDITRKIQLGAVTVVANGLLALGLTATPQTAHANPCAPQRICGATTAQCMNQSTILTACTNAAPAGCTATSATCVGPSCAGSFPLVFFYIDCNYN